MSVESYIGRVYQDRDSRSYDRQVKVVAVRGSGAHTKFQVEVIQNSVNPSSVGRTTYVSENTLLTKYRRTA